MAVEGAPIMTVECLCTSCAAAAVRMEARDGVAPAVTAWGGTDYVMVRKDRFAMEAGADLLAFFRLTPGAKTRRVVASCCGTPMFLEFEAGHWVSVYAHLWPERERPAVELRTMARDHADAAGLPTDVPNLATHNLRFMGRLLSAWVAMGFRVPKLDFVGKELTGV